MPDLLHAPPRMHADDEALHRHLVGVILADKSTARPFFK